MESASLGATQRSRAERLCQIAAFAVPWLLGLLHAAAEPHFADDVQLLRGAAALPIGLEGLISAGLSALVALMPVGNWELRAVLVAAAGLGAGSWLTYAFAQRLLRQHFAEHALNAPLALMAALGATLGPAWALEGSAPAGHAFAAALALGCLFAAAEPTLSGARRTLLVSALLAACALESRATATALGVAVLAPRLLAPKAVSRSQIVVAGTAAVAILLLPAVLALAVWLSPSPEAGLAWGLLRHGWELAPAPVERSASLTAWLKEVGVVGLVLSLGGVALGARDAKTRAVTLSMLAFPLADLALGGGISDPRLHDAMSGTRLVALAALSIHAALALRHVSSWLSRARIAFAPSLSALLVAYGFSLVFVGADDAELAIDARQASVVEPFTDEALASLPLHSAVLLRSPALTFRLLTAQKLTGLRPDVLVVSLPVVERGGARTELLARESGFLPLVRELLLTGKPNEYALSALADARPTFIEFEPNWEPRLRSHLVPHAFFTQFAPQPLARSDRREQLEHGEQALTRVLDELTRAGAADPATRSTLSAMLAQRALLLSSLGDREIAADVVKELLQIEPRSRVGLELKARLARPERERLEVADLFLTL